MKRLAASFALSGLLVAAAYGEPIEPIRLASTAFDEGRYREAARLAEETGHADSYALAARAVLAEVMCGEGDPPEEMLRRAEALAEAALADDPSHAEGRLQLAIAWSLRVRGLSRSAAWRTGLGTEARALVESVLEDDPDNAFGHGFLAVWHVEVVRRGGSFGAAMMDASLSEGLAHYAKAAELSPGDASLHWQMARALAAHNPRRHRDRIERALAAAAAATGETALEEVMARRAAVLGEALKTLSANDVKRLAAEML
ncbi:MAG: hypothetical protein AAFO57_06325 [Pseudomonadota bacterium]